MDNLMPLFSHKTLPINFLCIKNICNILFLCIKYIIYLYLDFINKKIYTI